MPPRGWVVDDTAGLGSRIRVVLYRKGERWRDARTVMYVNPLHQDEKMKRTFHQMIERDVASFLASSPRGKVTNGPELKTSKGQIAEVRYFSHEGGPPEEAVAYVAEEDLVMLLVLSSHSPGDFQGALPAFDDLVAGYQFVAGNIQVPR